MLLSQRSSPHILTFIAEEEAALDLGLGFQTATAVSLPTVPSNGEAWKTLILLKVQSNAVQDVQGD